MWTATTRLHLLNAVSRYGLRKPSFISAYIRVYSKEAPSNWKSEYNKMIREYVRNKEAAESVKEYFQRKRKEVIEKMIEKKKQEKTKIIERMIYGYDSCEETEESEEIGEKGGDACAESASATDVSVSAIYGIRAANPNPLSATLHHLSTLNNLPPHLELPGPKPEALLYAHEGAGEGREEIESSLDGQYCPPINMQEQELEEILNTLESSGYGISVSSIDSAAFERFFKWTLDKTAHLESKKKAMAEMQREAQESAQAARSEEESAQNAHHHALKEYYALDFHEYPKKKSPKDKAKWAQEFPLVIARLKSINGGSVFCDAHSATKPKENADEAKRQKKRTGCIKCFSAEILEEELEKDCRPPMAEYVFRAMLFLQTVLFSRSKRASPKEIDLVKSELYRFYEYYRK